MTPEVLAQIDAVVEDFKSKLFKVGPLRRINNTQRQALAEAYSLILNLPAILRGPDPRGSLREGKEADAQAWAQLTHSLAKVDPDWHTRGHSGAQAARLSIERLVDPEREVVVDGAKYGPLSLMVLEYFTAFPARVDPQEEARRYFAALLNNDRYEGAKDVREETS